jgi:plasmid stabilization system protein ParE
MRVRFTRTAQRDLVRIHATISEDSLEAAQQLVTRLIQRARGLADNPFEGRETDERGARVIISPSLALPYFLHDRRQRDFRPER